MSEDVHQQEMMVPPVLEGERVTFTGTLASMTHRQASQLVETHGGEATAHLSRQTTILVVGEEGWPIEEDGTPSQKYQHAQAWQEMGLAVRILRESEWLQVLGLADRCQDVHRLYTPAMLSQMLKLSTNLIRRWEQLGLITPVKRVARLPYFDFQEVARLSRLSQLLDEGISRHQLEKTLTAMEVLFPEANRTRTFLSLLNRGRNLLIQDDHGLIDPLSSQRIFEFEESAEEAPEPPALPFPFQKDSSSLEWERSADEWKLRGLDLLHDAFDSSAAMEAFRMSLMLDNSDPEVHFGLADALYQQGVRDAALERFYCVVEIERSYIEAWTQIGCIHVERDEFESAMFAFRIALSIHPDYPDAHIHLAEVLALQGHTSKAVEHWQRYLAFDDRGPWADLARQRLGLDYEQPTEFGDNEGFDEGEGFGEEE